MNPKWDYIGATNTDQIDTKTTKTIENTKTIINTLQMLTQIIL